MLVPDAALRSVVFLGIEIGDEFQPRGTGFIVSNKIEGSWFHYLVTARHVVRAIKNLNQNVIVRWNGKESGVRTAFVEHADWHFHPASDEAADVALTMFAPGDSDILNTSMDPDGPTPPATEAVIKEKSIGAGDEVAIFGLFSSHYGADRNFPVVRIGHIAMLRGEPVTTKSGPMRAHLVQAPSIGGLSGSPVFVSMPPFRNINGQSVLTRGPQFFLMGLMHGHFDVRNLNGDVGDRSVGAINSGIGIVAPVEHIIETLALPEVIAEARVLISNRASDKIRGEKADDASTR